MIQFFRSLAGRGGGSLPDPSTPTYADSNEALLVAYIGQSNAVGRAEASGLPPKWQSPQQACFMFHNTNKTFDVLQAGENDPSNPDLFGSEVLSLIKLRDHYGKYVYGVKSGQGGTSLAQDTATGKNDWNVASGELLPTAVTNITNAYNKLVSIGKTVTVALVWWQGEADGTRQDWANAYGQNEADLFSYIRQTAFLSNAKTFVFKVFETSPAYPYCDLVNQAKVVRAATDNLTVLIETGSYSLKSDGIHADHNGQVQAGTDLANALISAL